MAVGIVFRVMLLTVVGFTTQNPRPLKQIGVGERSGPGCSSETHCLPAGIQRDIRIGSSLMRIVPSASRSFDGVTPWRSPVSSHRTVQVDRLGTFEAAGLVFGL